MSEQDSESMAVALPQREPFTPIRDTEDLVEMIAREVVVDIEREYAQHPESGVVDAWALACEYAHQEIETTRTVTYRSILSLYQARDVVYYNQHELRLFAQLAESLESPR